MPWLVTILTALAAFGLTRLSIPISVRIGALDLPNARSSHSRPMPRLGGLGIAGAVIVGMWTLAAFQQGRWVGTYHLTLRSELVVAAALVMAATGLCDDLFHLRARAKFLVQLVLAVVIVAWGFRLEVVELGESMTFGLGLAAIPVTIIWLTGFANGFNFMDGIDGISATTAAAYFAFFYILARSVGSADLAMLALVFLGSCIGALPLNFPSARTFIGDTGSLMLGIALALYVVMLVQDAPRLMVPLLLVCSAYLWDTAYTLVRRLSRGENIFTAHRSHLYQRLIQLGNSHAKITSLYLVLHVTLGSLGLLYVHARGMIRMGSVVFAFLLLSAFTYAVHKLEARVSRVGSD